MMKARHKAECKAMNEKKDSRLKALFNSSFCILTSALLFELVCLA